MKYPVKAYAKILADLAAKDLGQAKEKQWAENFLNLLEKKGEMKKARRIVDLAKKLYLKKIGAKKVVVETARPAKGKHLEHIKSWMKKNDILENRINPEIIAGIKICVNDENLFDASIIRKIKEMF